MSRIWHIIVREYLENVRTKAFIIGIVLTPLWFGLVFLGPSLAKGQEVGTEKVVIVDATGLVAPDLQRALGAERTGKGRPRFDVTVEEAAGAWSGDPSRVADLRSQAAAGDLYAVLITDATLAKRAPADGEPETGILYPGTVGGTDTARVLLATVQHFVNGHIMAERGIDPDDAALLARPALAMRGLSRTGEDAGAAQALAPLFFMMFLFMGIIGISQMLVNSTIEEKGSRVYEVLLSSVSPSQLMAGKILGICGVGFTLMLLWTGVSLAAAGLSGMGGLVTGGQLGLFVAYYVLGFLFIASLMVAIGSACNTLKEAQNLMAPVSMMLAMPLFLALVVLKNPNGAVATAASFFPPFTPFLMMARVSAVPGPPTWQIAASLLVLAIATVFAVLLAGRVFRVGILMYGKPPKLGEIVRWMFSRA